MVQAVINIQEETNRILNIVKAKYGLNDKSAAIELVVAEYEENFLNQQEKTKKNKEHEKWKQDLKKRNLKYQALSDADKIKYNIKILKEYPDCTERTKIERALL